MSIESLGILSLNPFLMQGILQNFLQGYGGEAEFDLVFYVLPIILYKESRDKLITANSKSRIDTLFGNKDILEYDSKRKISSMTRLGGFTQRFNELQELTKRTIIVLCNENKIELREKIVLLKKYNYKNYKGSKDHKSTLKAAYYLGVVFSTTSIQLINEFLGVV
jgi:hypothetical protein